MWLATSSSFNEIPETQHCPHSLRPRYGGRTAEPIARDRCMTSVGPENIFSGTTSTGVVAACSTRSFQRASLSAATFAQSAWNSAQTLRSRSTRREGRALSPRLMGRVERSEVVELHRNAGRSAFQQSRQFDHRRCRFVVSAEWVRHTGSSPTAVRPASTMPRRIYRSRLWEVEPIHRNSRRRPRFTYSCLHQTRAYPKTRLRLFRNRRCSGYRAGVRAFSDKL